MLVLRLFDHFVSIAPPQHLLLLEINDPAVSNTITIVHETGYQAEGEMVLVARTPIPVEAPREASDTDIATPLPGAYLRTFPEISEIDLWNLPMHYKMLNTDLSLRFTFQPGKEYSVSLVGDRMLEITIVAS